MKSYFASLPGRALLASTGFFLLGPGLAAVLESPAASIRIFAICPLLGSAAAIISAGWGMFSYPRQTVAFILYLPVLLWLTLPGFGVMVNHGWSVGVGVMLVGIGFLIAAARPAAGAKPGEFTADGPQGAAS